MSGIYGIIGVPDGDPSYVNTIGQVQVFEAAQKFLEMHNEDLDKAYSVFFETSVEIFKERYYAPGGGRLQLRSGHTQSAAVKATSSWDVAYPLFDYGAQIAFTDVAIKKLKLPMLQRHLDTVRIQDMNTFRYEMLYAIFNSNTRAITDEEHGSLTVMPLANGDSDTLYPPVIGSETQATDNHYLESGYAATAISNSNNPYLTIREELAEHWGDGDVAVFINPAETPETEALSDFDPVNDRYVRPGANTDQIENSDFPNVPGKVIGRVSDVWVVEWRYIPASYMVGIDLMMPGPLKKRLDPAEQGFAEGLELVSKDSRFPFDQSHYRNRFGVGAGNRLNGVVMELGTGGTYTIPTAYQ